VYVKAACGLQTTKFNSTYVNVTLAQLVQASLCGNIAFSISFVYSIGCALPAYNHYGAPTKDLVMMHWSALHIVSSNSSFNTCLQSNLYLQNLLFSNPGNSTSGAVQCVPYTRSPTPPTTFSPSPPTTTNRPTVIPTFSPTTATQNALAVDFRSVPSPLVFVPDPYYSPAADLHYNPADGLIYGAYQTTLLTCTPSAATPACLACEDPAYMIVTFPPHDYQCVSHAPRMR